MPRRSYEAHRMAKNALRRRGSVIESETDAESLASYTTYQSNSSYITQHSSNPSPRLGGYQYNGANTSLNALGISVSSSPGNQISRLVPLPRERTFSSSSSQRPALPSPRLEVPRSHSANVRTEASPQKRPQGSLLEENAATSRKTAERDERRRKRREEREKKSTLVGEKFDSPLRQWLRWMSQKGQSRWSLPLGLGVAAVVRILALCTKGEGWNRSRATHALAETMFWWSAVLAWTVLEGRKGGRSWRTQVIGVMTVILHPVLQLDETSLSSLGLILWSTILLTRGFDVLGCLFCGLAVLADRHSLTYIPAVAAYVLGKAVWLGDSRGTTLTLKTVSTGLATYLGQKYWLARQSAGSSTPLSFTTPPPISGISLTQIGLLALGLAPTLLVIIYASISTRPAQTVSNGTSERIKIIEPTDRSSTPPTTRLLVLSLYTIALSFSMVCLPSGTGISSTYVLPLTLLMAMRGGKDNGEEGHDTWEMGMFVSVATVLSEWPVHASWAAQSYRLCSTLLWIWILGYKPWQIQNPLMRRATYAVYAVSTLIALSSILPLAQERTSKAVSSVDLMIGLGVQIFAWAYANKKLFENAWAMGGLEGLGSRKGRSIDKID